MASLLRIGLVVSLPNGVLLLWLIHGGDPNYLVTPPKTNECPLKRDYFNPKYFQPLIFSKHLSFPKGNKWDDPPSNRVFSFLERKQKHLEEPRTLTEEQRPSGRNSR